MEKRQQALCPRRYREVGVCEGSECLAVFANRVDRVGLRTVRRGANGPDKS